MDPERENYADPGAAVDKPSPLWEAAVLGLSILAIFFAEFLLIELGQRLGLPGFS